MYVKNEISLVRAGSGFLLNKSKYVSQLKVDKPLTLVIYPFSASDIIAATCDFQQCGILTSVDSDEPVHISSNKNCKRESIS